MSEYVTVVLKLPKKDDGVRNSFPSEFQIGNTLSGCEITGMSLEDEMTILELIEQHEDFEPHIGEEARAKAKEFHAEFEATA